MQEKMNPLKSTARIAGFWYLLLSIIGAYGLAYVPSQIMGEGNAASTVNNILTHEFLFRTGVVSQLISNTLFVLLVSVLYRLLKHVNEYHAKLMMAFVLVQVPIAFLIETFKITSLMILKGEIMKAIEPAQKQDLVMLFLNIHTYGTIILEIFWGLWLIPFGQLVYKSGFIPRILGVLLIIGGISYIIESLTFLLFPGSHALVSRYTSVCYSIGEIAIMLWLLIIGVRVRQDVTSGI